MSKKSLLLCALAVVLVIPPGGRVVATSAADFDLIVAGGRVVDGTGNPWLEADIAIRDGIIAEIGKLDPKRGARVVDAKGLIVAPGFVDVHTHIEGGIVSQPAAENFLRMGVTSVVTGNCGGSSANLREWFSRLEQNGISVNVASLIGHNTVRRAGMNGDFDRPPTGEELQRMRDLVAQAMRDGAVGLSTGLIYIPGTYSKTEEVVELAKVAALHGGVYATHMRDEGEFVEKSIKETLEIGALAGCPVEISHFKVSNKRRWGASVNTIKLVEDARKRGQQVTVDQYLYTASSTNLGVRFPSWIFDGGNEKTKERLLDSTARARIKREMIAENRRSGRLNYSYAVVANYRPNPSFNGKNITEITRMARGKSGVLEEVEQMIEMLLAGGAQMIYHSMSDADVERIFRQPFTMIASDAGVVDPSSASMPHPRGFGNNARALGVYVREKRLVGLEDAIRKMSSLPAQTFRLWDRGLLRPGMAADIVIFDEKRVADRATFEQPKQYAAGIAFVIVNGRIVVEGEKHSGAKPGKILRGRGAKA
jgi:N-acyl-D-amino-acid deacylase